MKYLEWEKKLLTKNNEMKKKNENSLMCQFYVPLVYYKNEKYNHRIEKFNKKKLFN